MRGVVYLVACMSGECLVWLPEWAGGTRGSSSGFGWFCFVAGYVFRCLGFVCGRSVGCVGILFGVLVGFGFVW